MLAEGMGEAPGLGHPHCKGWWVLLELGPGWVQASPSPSQATESYTFSSGTENIQKQGLFGRRCLWKANLGLFSTDLDK